MYRNLELTVKPVYRYEGQLNELELELETIVQELIDDEEEVELIWL